MLNRKMIYAAPQKEFFSDVRLNKFSDKMQNNFLNIYGKKTNLPEYNSWTDSGKVIKNLLELTNLSDIYVCFEYQVPYSQKRIDCLLFGKNNVKKGVMIHIELKQWQKVDALECEGNFVETYTGGASRTVPHPSQQVEGYNNYLRGFVEIFEEKEMDLFGCAYCPNYNKINQRGLFDDKYKLLIKKYPIYTKQDVEKLANRLKELLNQEDGFDVFNKFMESPLNPSRKLLDNASKVIKKESDFNLLDDQIYARNIILDKIKKANNNQENSVILVKGGPGTGKTVIALHILAEFASNKEKAYKIFFASRSKPLIEAIKFKMEKGQKAGEVNAKILFTNLNQYVPNKINEKEIDILIIDEAHRIGEKSNHRFSKKEDRTDMPQIEQLIRCSKTSIFFIDDKQTIRNAEIGNSELIKDFGKKLNRKIAEVELKSQFRCNGSDNYLNWLEYVLGHSKEELIFNKETNFDFQIIDSPKKLYELIKQKNSKKGFSARLVAGYCWPWSTKLNENGELNKDVKIDNFEMPWETHGNINPPNGYVKWFEWAYKPEGIKQIGCIYTTQGFEFDYIGVIIGPDLKYDKINDCLLGNIEGTKDPTLKRDKTRFDKYIKNIYRVLMSRGMKGCYVYFVDKEVEAFFKSKMSK